jgi:hypothetical protein
MHAVSYDKWRDAVKFLMGQGVNPSLSSKDQRVLREQLRGPFSQGMTEEQARSVLTALGWQKR